MAPQHEQESRIRASTVGGETTEHEMETMSGTILKDSSSHPWFSRAIVGLAGLALVGAVSIGIDRGSPEQPEAPTIETRAGAVAPAVTERFREFKAEQAEQRANPGMEAPVQASSAHYRELKTRQVEQQLEAAPVVSSPAAPSAWQRFTAMKDQQAMGRAQDSLTATSSAAPMSDVYRALKTRQLDAMLAGEASTAHWSNVSDEYRALKQRQLEQVLSTDE